MSLKGKIEAIIYAAEEPVTLAQLFGLLGQEAAGELDAHTARQADLFREAAADHASNAAGIPPRSEPDDLNQEVLEPSDQELDLLVELDEQANPQPTPDQPPTGSNPKPHKSQPDQSQPADQAPTPIPPDDKLLQREQRERERAIRDHLRDTLDELIRDYRDGDRGLEIREVASGFRLATRPEYHDAVRGFARSLKPPLKLSLQALETLAVVAYKQPVTAPEVAEIRGVDSAGVLGSLASRKLVTTAGRKQVVGRPILYKTTKEFLLRFGLRDLNELPSIEEFERLAGDLADAEPQQETIPLSNSTPDPTNPDSITQANLREEADATEPQADGSGDTEAEIGIPVDGRLSGPPPAEDQPADSSAGDAALQAEEAQTNSETSAQYAAENGTED